MYDISISIVSKTHKLEKRTEIIKIQLSQTSKDTQEPPRSDAFSHTWRTYERCGITIF